MLDFNLADRKIEAVEFACDGFVVHRSDVIGEPGNLLLLHPFEVKALDTYEIRVVYTTAKLKLDEGDVVTDAQFVWRPA